jgi:hypothetical protein
MPRSDALTTIQVHERTRKLLASRKKDEQTYEDVIMELFEEDPTEAQILELERRLREHRDVPWEATQRKISR